MDFESFLDLLRALASEAVDNVLVVGVPLNHHGIVRATEDVDLFIRPSGDNFDRLKRALGSLWNDPEIGEISAEDLIGDSPTIRYGPPHEAFVVDLLACLEGVPARVATPATRYRMKKDTIRPIDQAAAAALREKFRLGGARGGAAALPELGRRAPRAVDRPRRSDAICPNQERVAVLGPPGRATDSARRAPVPPHRGRERRAGALGRGPRQRADGGAADSLAQVTVIRPVGGLALPEPHAALVVRPA